MEWEITPLSGRPGRAHWRNDPVNYCAISQLFIFRASNPWTWMIPGSWYWLQGLQISSFQASWSFDSHPLFICGIHAISMQGFWLNSDLVTSEHPICLTFSLNSVSINQHCEGRSEYSAVQCPHYPPVPHLLHHPPTNRRCLPVSYLSMDKNVFLKKTLTC